jgi:hypothetical protein
MTFSKRIGIGLLLVGLAGSIGCTGQDPDQPAVGSISANARKDSPVPSLPAGKTKAAPTLGK